jgi:hypothetical protein
MYLRYERVDQIDKDITLRSSSQQFGGRSDFSRLAMRKEGVNEESSFQKRWVAEGLSAGKHAGRW